MPTTCCYQQVKSENCEIVQYFVMQGLGSCVLLEDFLAHHFYSGTFVHNTSVGVAIDNCNRVHVTNKEKFWGTMVGWGEGIPKKKDSVS